MKKVEFANIVYKWLKSEEKMITVSLDDHIGKRTVLLVKLPCTKKGYENALMVIAGDIWGMDDWDKYRNIYRIGFWIPSMDIFLEDMKRSFLFREVNSHFVSEEKFSIPEMNR